MKVYSSVVLTIVMISAGVGVSDGGWEDLTGRYLDQPEPAAEPEVFAPGVISHGFHELGITFSPDGNEFFYITSDARYQHYVLLHVEQRDGRWSAPKVAPFAASLSVYSASLDSGGNTLFFTGRPLATTTGERAEHDIFIVKKKNGRWGAAENLGEPVNSDGSESSVSVARDGTLFFSRPDENHSSDIWKAVWDGDRYEEPTRLGPTVNSESSEARPYIAPDQSYLLFQSDRKDSLGFMDIYISLRAEDGSWGEPVNLGPGVSSTASDFAPSVTPDGRFLFFSSYRGIDPEVLSGRSYQDLLELYRRPANGYSTLYWVDAAKLDLGPGKL